MKAELDSNGHEVGDPLPVAMPLGMKEPETLAHKIQRMVKSHISAAADAAGYETFEEGDDFNVDDDMDPDSPFELEFDPILGREVSAQMMAEHADKYRAEYLKKAADDYDLRVMAENYKADAEESERHKNAPAKPEPPTPVVQPPVPT